MAFVLSALRPPLQRARPTRSGPRRELDRLPLVVSAAVTLVVGVAFDVLADEHATHTFGLALVALAVAGLRLRLAGCADGILSAVSGAVVAQPVLHATAKIDTDAATSRADGLLHVVVADGPTTAMHLVVSAAIVIAVALSGRLAQLLLGALCQPVRLVTSGPLPLVRPHLSPQVSVQRHGSMLRWCGWSIRAARRGPPVSPPSPTLPAEPPDHRGLRSSALAR